MVIFIPGPVAAELRDKSEVIVQADIKIGTRGIAVGVSHPATIGSLVSIEDNGIALPRLAGDQLFFPGQPIPLERRARLVAGPANGDLERLRLPVLQIKLPAAHGSKPDVIHDTDRQRHTARMAKDVPDDTAVITAALHRRQFIRRRLCNGKKRAVRGIPVVAHLIRLLGIEHHAKRSRPVYLCFNAPRVAKGVESLVLPVGQHRAAGAALIGTDRQIVGFAALQLLQDFRAGSPGLRPHLLGAGPEALSEGERIHRFIVEVKRHGMAAFGLETVLSALRRDEADPFGLVHPNVHRKETIVRRQVDIVRGRSRISLGFLFCRPIIQRDRLDGQRADCLFRRGLLRRLSRGRLLDRIRFLCSGGSFLCRHFRLDRRFRLRRRSFFRPGFLRGRHQNFLLCLRCDELFLALGQRRSGQKAETHQQHQEQRQYSFPTFHACPSFPFLTG